MEIDTGASVSIISELQQKRIFPEATIAETKLRLQTYTGETMRVIGQMEAKVRYGEQENNNMLLYVVAGNGPTLLGRNWLEQIQLDWNTIRQVNAKQPARDLESLLQEYNEVFTEELGTIRPFTAKSHIRSDVPPKFCRARSVPFAIKSAIETELERLESSGILKKVDHSEWAAPIVAVPKKDGKLRICGDYKVTVNQALDVDQYPLPKPENLFVTLAGGNKFTKLDLSQAYQQLPLEEESRKYVTINTHKGLYQYTRLPFGIASAPAMFQKMMDTVLQGIPNVICYIDDILVTGADDEAHLRTLSLVLEKLQKHGIRMKKTKCCFMADSVEYLGHQIDAQGLHPTTDKVDAVVQAPIPKNVQELRSFLGLLNYYGKFLPNLATTLHPLNCLLKKGARWQWTPECNTAFETAKSHLVSSCVLVHYDPTLPLKLAADASAYGVGAVISNVMSNGEERPIAFASRTLQPSERNYAQLEKEALALIFGIKKFHQYLFGRKFTLITDHKPLLAILGPKKGIPSLAAARLQRWAVLLAAYNYELEFKPTDLHSNADGLSRLPLQSASQLGAVPEATNYNIRQLEVLPITAQAIKAATRTDAILSKVLLYTQQGWPAEVSEALQPFITRKCELTIEDGCLLWGVRVIIPKNLQPDILVELHHGHPGISKMKALARGHFWWPGLDKEIEEMAKSCQSCQAVKSGPPAAPLHPWSWPSQPWQRVHIDFAGPFLGKMFLLTMDSHSKWPEVIEMSQTSTSQTINVLRALFSRYGLPQQIVSDNGPQFVSEEFAAFMRSNGIKHTRCAPYHPSSNGAVERFVQSFKQAMKASEKDGLSLPHQLANFLLMYRSTPHTTTGVSPASLFMGRNLRTRFDLIRPDIHQRVVDKQSQQKKDHDQHVQVRTFQVGERVMVKNFRSGPNWVPATITQQDGPVSYTVCVENGQLWKRHLDHIKSKGQNVPTEFSPSDVDTSTFTEIPLPTGSPTVEADTTPPIPSDSTAVARSSRYPRRTRHPPQRFDNSLS